MDELLFDLRKEAHQYGIQVIFADMRWGIRDENTKDHMTWVECANGIHYCKQQSLGVCFLSLQGDKYGYTPLPRSIRKSDLDEHLAVREIDQGIKNLIFKWYILDENAIPNEYVLRNMSDTKDSEFWKDYETILPTLTGIRFDRNDDTNESLIIGRSVTEWEVRRAMSSFPVEVGKSSSFLWSYRKLQYDDEKDHLYNDVVGDGLGLRVRVRFRVRG